MSTDPTPQHGPATPDPSMDDILASIRRILDEEGAPASSPAAPGKPADDDVLDLDASMLVEAPDDVPPHDDVQGPVPLPPPTLVEPVTAPEPLHPMPEPVAEDTHNPHVPSLVAPAAAAAAAMSVAALMRTLATERSTAVHRGGPTIEDLVREEIRPVLKEWLDTHLPPLVERLVRAEIERVVSRVA